MSQPMPGMNLHGAVDLSSLATPPAGAAGQRPGGAPGAPVAGAVVIEVTEETFGEAVQRSTQVPVIMVLWAGWAAPSQELLPVLEKLAAEYGGRFQLAEVDVDANPQVAAAFQAKSVPSVVAVIGGQPVPLFQGAYPEDQLRPVLDEVLRLAAQNGVTGVLEVVDGEVPEVPQEPELPPLYAEAMAAIERGDLAAAEAAYTQALAENPRDDEARAALLQVQLIRRVDHDDPEELLARADAAPDDVPAQLAAADVEAATGRFAAAFDRLLAVVRSTAGDEREQARLRLIDLFEIAGPTVPEVQDARRKLASALY